MKTIYLLLTKTDTVLSNIIARVTGDPYTHVAISLNKELTELYSFGRKVKNNPLKAGFIKEHLVGSIYEENLHCDCAVYKANITDEQYEKLTLELIKMRSEQNKYKYNLLGLLNFILHINLKRKNKYFCSEFVAEMLRRIDVLPVQYTPQKTRPIDFTKMPIFSELYSGKLGAIIA